MAEPNIKFVNLNSSVLLDDNSNFSFIYLKDNEGNFKYKTIDNKIFKNNLILIESHLPQILSELILQSFIGKEQSLSALIEILGHQNPDKILNLNSIEFYKYKIKEFLKHLALGFSTYEVYFGEQNMYNHYPVLKTKDEILYYVENTNLFLSTLLERAIFVISNKGEFIEMDKNYIKLSFRIILKP